VANGKFGEVSGGSPRKLKVISSGISRRRWPDAAREIIEQRVSGGVDPCDARPTRLDYCENAIRTRTGKTGSCLIRCSSNETARLDCFSCAATSMALAGAKQVFTERLFRLIRRRRKRVGGRLLSLRPAEGITNSASLTNYIKRISIRSAAAD